MKKINAGFAGTRPPVDGCGEWEEVNAFIHPLIEGISDKLWTRIYNETNDYRPMFGKDGSKVYYDDEAYQIVRMLNGKRIAIANVTIE